MNNLVTLNNISLAYGLNPLLDSVKLQITEGERVCLIGRNGAGKSSLLKIIEGATAADSGAIWRKPGLRLARLEQELPPHSNLTVYEFVAGGLADIGSLLTAYHNVAQHLAHDPSEQNLVELARLQKAIDTIDGWQFDNTIKTVLQRLELEPDKMLGELSGGWQRRTALAKALVVKPELLLLDEPTNHLDISAIQWLEEQLISSNIGLLFITHDRSLLQRLATRIIELDRGYLTSWPGDYANFLRRKEEMLHAEALENSRFDKKLVQEEQWIRQGIKARRTRNEGRVRALEGLRLERSKRRDVQGKASFNVNQGEKSGQLVIEAEKINHSFNEELVISDFSMRIARGDKVGLIGPNGVGKSTLLNILLGMLSPEHGTVKHGTKLQVAYFDQLRQALDLEKTVIENVSQGQDTVEINGKKMHIMSYLSDFLFSPQRSLTPVKALSGGECNRLLLARLFSKPSNLLVLDEPTNDLDIETLELLEELLSHYTGTLLLVSHDRTFLDNVVTSTLVFEGGGKIQEYVGGYQDWLKAAKITLMNKLENNIEANKELRARAKANKKLSYKDQKELDQLPALIEKLESQQTELQQLTSTAEFYQQEQAAIAQKIAELQALEKKLTTAYQRWEKLEKLANDLI